MAIDLSVNLNGFRLKNPILTASGTYGYSDEYSDFVNPKELGGIVTKAISLNPKLGNEGKRIFETYGGMINRIGLENVGIQKFIEEKLPVLNKKEINSIMNLAGSSFEEYVETAKIADKNGIKAIELNVSCPNVKQGCLEFGVDPKSLYELVSSVRNVYNGFLAVKLTPNVSDIESLAIASEKAGADCISAINTLKGLGVKIEINGADISKTFVQGGLSGKCIKPVALSMVKRIKEAVKIPIIGIGGITSASDVLEFFTVGAEAVQIGTENFTNPDVTGEIITDLENIIRNLNIANLDELKRILRK